MEETTCKKNDELIQLNLEGWGGGRSHHCLHIPDSDSGFVPILSPPFVDPFPTMRKPGRHRGRRAISWGDCRSKVHLELLIFFCRPSRLCAQCRRRVLQRWGLEFAGCRHPIENGLSRLSDGCVSSLNARVTKVCCWIPLKKY